MTGVVPTSDDVRRLADQLIAELTPQQQQTFLVAVGADHSTALIGNTLRVPDPTVLANWPPSGHLA